MKYLLLALLTITACSCTTITASKGDMRISRTAFAVNLGIPEIVITENSDNSFTLALKGAVSDSTSAIEAAVTGALKGAAMATKP